jgi:hypothetical protein
MLKSLEEYRTKALPSDDFVTFTIPTTESASLTLTGVIHKKNQTRQNAVLGYFLDPQIDCRWQPIPGRYW